MAAEKPFFIYSATFAFYDYPRDLWPAHLVRLKGMGFNTIFVPLSSDGETLRLIEAVRLARQLGLRVWLSTEAPPPELEPFTASRGGPILENVARRPFA